MATLSHGLLGLTQQGRKVGKARLQGQLKILLRRLSCRVQAAPYVQPCGVLASRNAHPNMAPVMVRIMPESAGLSPWDIEVSRSYLQNAGLSRSSGMTDSKPIRSSAARFLASISSTNSSSSWIKKMKNQDPSACESALDILLHGLRQLVLSQDLFQDVRCLGCLVRKIPQDHSGFAKKARPWAMPPVTMWTRS